MHDDGNPEKRVRSRQDGEDPNLRTDYLSERGHPGLHGGGGDPGWKADYHERQEPGHPPQVDRISRPRPPLQGLGPKPEGE